MNCTLTQQSSTIRKDTLASPYTPGTIPTSSSIQTVAPTSQIVTSGGVNDGGLFELNFHDERYLPFEGTGVISTFQIDLPLQSNPFDVGRLEDLVLHLKYTARDGGSTFRGAVMATIPSPRTGSWLIRVAADQATAWYQLMNPASGATARVLQLDLQEPHFPYLPGGGAVTITSLHAAAQGPAFQGSATSLSFTVTPPTGTAPNLTVAAPTSPTAWPGFDGVSLSPGTWTLTLPTSFDPLQRSAQWHADIGFC